MPDMKIALITERESALDEVGHWLRSLDQNLEIFTGEKSELEQRERTGQFDLALLDMRLNEEGELAYLRGLKKDHVSQGDIICLSEQLPGEIGKENAVKNGAFCVLDLAAELDFVKKMIKLCIDKKILLQENLSLKKTLRLYERIRKIALIIDLDKLIHTVLDTAIEMSRANCGAVFLWRQDIKTYEVNTFRDINEEFLKPNIFGLDKDYLHDIIDQGKAVLLTSLQALPAFTQNFRIEKRVGSLIISPIITQGFKLGGIVLARYDWEKDNFVAANLEQTIDLISGVAEAMHNALLHSETERLTIKDDLTVAYNRRYFDKFIDEELIRCQRYGSPLSLIFMDLDDLKQVNTDHGHYMGSKVLRDVAVRLTSSVRSIDKVFRYGGDEFCVVLPETDSHGAYQVAERVRKHINGRKFELTNMAKITMTGSFGIASYPLHASTKEELVNFADKAVYKVKTSTKDSVLIAATDLESN